MLWDDSLYEKIPATLPTQLSRFTNLCPVVYLRLPNIKLKGSVILQISKVMGLCIGWLSRSCTTDLLKYRYTVDKQYDKLRISE